MQDTDDNKKDTSHKVKESKPALDRATTANSFFLLLVALTVIIGMAFFTLQSNTTSSAAANDSDSNNIIDAETLLEKSSYYYNSIPSAPQVTTPRGDITLSSILNFYSNQEHLLLTSTAVVGSSSTERLTSNIKLRFQQMRDCIMSVLSLTDVSSFDSSTYTNTIRPVLFRKCTSTIPATKSIIIPNSNQAVQTEMNSVTMLEILEYLDFLATHREDSLDDDSSNDYNYDEDLKTFIDTTCHVIKGNNNDATDNNKLRDKVEDNNNNCEIQPESESARNVEVDAAARALTFDSISNATFVTLEQVLEGIEKNYELRLKANDALTSVSIKSLNQNVSDLIESASKKSTSALKNASDSYHFTKSSLAKEFRKSERDIQIRDQDMKNKLKANYQNEINKTESERRVALEELKNTENSFKNDSMKRWYKQEKHRYQNSLRNISIEFKAKVKQYEEELDYMNRRKKRAISEIISSHWKELFRTELNSLRLKNKQLLHNLKRQYEASVRSIESQLTFYENATLNYSNTSL